MSKVIKKICDVNACVIFYKVMEGSGITDIAKYLGVTRMTVYRFIKAYPDIENTPYWQKFKDIKHGVKALYWAGKTTTEIMTQYGIEDKNRQCFIDCAIYGGCIKTLKMLEEGGQK